MSSVTVAGQDHMRVGTQAIRLDMTVSLDGFVVGPEDSTEEPMGIGGVPAVHRLDPRPDPGPNGPGFPASAPAPAATSRPRPHRPANRRPADHHAAVRSEAR